MMAVLKNTSFLLCPATVLTARATEEVGTSKMASTFCCSNQARAMLAPMSGLFWWSAETNSTVSAMPESCTAMRAAITEPVPAKSENTEPMSVSTPILTWGKGA